MIPNFPNFRELNISDKELIDQYVTKYPPYSDYNFISLYVWNIDPPPLISLLNGNLVVRLNDYITNEPFFSFLGTQKTLNTATALLDYSINNGFPDYLKLIPESNLDADLDIFNKFKIVEDRDQFDYIFSLQDLEKHQGGKYAEKRNFINKFKKSFQFEDKLLDLKDLEVQKTVIRLFERWGISRKKDRDEITQELKAYKKLLETCHNLNLITIGLFVNEDLIGISINEVLHDGYAINLFEKGDVSFGGVFQMMKHLAGMYLIKAGCKLLNFEQDLGVEGLRKSKTSYHPIFYLKKYIIYSKG